MISRHKGRSGANGIARFINPYLDFNIELERQKGGEVGLAGPAYYFLPFYVDQDEGWSSTWSSFEDLKQFKKYRALMIDYHLGVRSQDYYDAIRIDLEYKGQKSEIVTKRLLMQETRNSVHERKQQMQVDLDPDVFRAEAEELVEQYNVIYADQQNVLSNLKNIRNKRNTVDSEIQLIQKTIDELEADYKYSESPKVDDLVGCPTCGTEFANSFVERFDYLDDIDRSYDLLDQLKKERNNLSDTLNGINQEYKNVSSQLSEVKGTLSRTKQNTKFSEFITSEGIKELLAVLDGDIRSMLEQEQDIEGKISENAVALEPDKKRKKSILDWYKARMKEFLNVLNVTVLNEKDYKLLDRQIKGNALGSDLPRALLAQYFAFLHTMKEFKSFVLCPMLIDSPFQQEQDTVNRGAVLDFILTKRLENQQMILATVSISEFEGNPTLEDATTYTFSDKTSVLKKDQYAGVLKDIGPLHDITLAASE